MMDFDFFLMLLQLLPFDTANNDNARTVAALVDIIEEGAAMIECLEG
jgi:hypothetical protein